MATATITVHALCYMAVLDGSTVAITGVLYSAIAMADRTFDLRVSLVIGQIYLQNARLSLNT